MSQTKAQLIEGLNINTSAPADALVIDSSGKVGVGTTSPADNLTVSGSSGAVNLGITANTANAYDSPSLKFLGGNLSTSSILFGDASDADVGKIIYNHDGNSLAFTVNASERLRIDSSGNVGIGTSSPVGKTYISGPNASTFGVAADAALNLAAANGALVNRVVNLNFACVDSATNAVAAIGLKYTSQSGFGKGDLIFGTRNVTTDTAPTERMRIDSSGNVGIGTASPGQLLHLSSASPRILLTQTSANSNAFLDAATSGVLEFSADDNNVASSSSIRFKVDGNEHLRIDSLGRVGIGTTSPQMQDGNANPVVHLFAASSPVEFRAQRNDGADAFFTARSQELQIGTNTDHRVEFRTNDTERMRIDTSGRLLVGGTNTYHANADDLVVQGTGQVGVTIASTSTGKSNLFFADSTSNPGTYACYFEYDHSLDALKIGQGNSERIRLDSAGRVMLGTTTAGVADADQLTVASSSSTGITIRSGTSGNGNLFFSDGTSGDAQYDGFIQYQHAHRALKFGTAAAEKLRIDSSGRMHLGTSTTRAGGFGIAKGFASSGVPAAGTSTSSLLVGNDDGGMYGLAMGANGSGNGYIQAQRSDGNTTIYDLFIQPNGGKVGVKNTSPSLQYFNDLVIGDGSGDHGITLHTSSSGSSAISFSDATSGSGRYAGYLQYDHSTDSMSFYTGGGGRRLTIDNNGNLTNKSSNVGSVAGEGFTLGREADSYLIVTRDSDTPLFLNRMNSDGNLVQFYAQTNLEGTISVSGHTVSYNGGHLSRWSQLAGGAERTEILRGSVLSNLDEMCEWGEEGNEQLNRMKVSDVEGDVNVAGVFQAWDDDDDTYTNDFYCAMTGDFIIRIAQGTTVARGDLLMSAGDGTAKPQDDDIVRSKTIAKVTSTTVSTTYADGSYCVPCVLMAC